MATACLLSLIAALRIVSLFSRLPSRSNQVDYSIYYLSGYVLRHGGNPYSMDLRPLAGQFGMDTLGISRATDPPTFLAMLEPLTTLSPEGGYWAWTALNALALIVALWLLLRPSSKLHLELSIALAALAMMDPAVMNHFYYGQNKVQILLLLVLAMRWLESGRDAAAGLALALAGLMRVFPLLLVGYLLIERRYRAIAFTLIGLVGGLIATGLALGFRVELSFFNGIDVLTGSRWLAYDTNIALGSFVSRLYWANFGMRPGGGVETLRHVTVAAAALVLLVLTCRATLCTRPAGDTDSRAFCLWVATAVALSPTAWIHYMVLLFIPFARICSAADRDRSSSAAITLAVLSYTLLFFGCPWGCVDISGELFYLVAPHAHHFTKTVIFQTATLSLLLGWAAAYAFARSSVGSESANGT